MKQERNPFEVQWHAGCETWRGLITTVLAVLVLSGCGTPRVEDAARVRTLTEQLGHIDTVRLEEHSSTEPVSVEKATAEVTEQIAEPNETAPAVELTIEEVRAAALANNLDLKVELIDPAIAKQDLDAERAKFESVFRGSTGYRRTEAPDDGSVSRSSSHELGVESPLHTGGAVTASVPFSTFDSSDAGFDGVSEAAVSVSFIQSLFRDAGTRINTHSIRIAGYGKHIVDARTKLSAISILANADIAYWYLYAARRELDVRREQYKLAQNQLEHARGLVESGSAAKIEIVLAEAGLAGRLEGVINAETRVLDRERDLKLIMNREAMPLNSIIRIITATEPDPLGLDLDDEAMVKAALSNRMEMAQLEFRLAIDEINVELARNRRLPRVTFDYTYRTSAQSETVGRTFERIADSSFDDHSVGLSATIPLGNEAAEARFRRARLERLQSQFGLERRELLIRQEVYDAVNELRQNWRRILAAEQGAAAARRDYEVQQSQFQLGKRTSTDVLFAATRLGDAQLRRVGAFTEYEIAQIRLARATGTLLGYGQIQLEPIDINSQ
ncbi:MAG: TolC family protein [Planctomycetota bacterium]|jgi:outer membrane protein TolC